MPALEGIYACRLEKSWVIRLMRADRRGPTRTHELNTQVPLFRYGLCAPHQSGHNRGDYLGGRERRRWSTPFHLFRSLATLPRCLTRQKLPARGEFIFDYWRTRLAGSQSRLFQLVGSSPLGPSKRCAAPPSDSLRQLQELLLLQTCIDLDHEPGRTLSSSDVFDRSTLAAPRLVYVQRKAGARSRYERWENLARLEGGV